MRAFFEDLQQRLEQRSVLIYSKGKFDDIQRPEIADHRDRTEVSNNTAHRIS